MDNNTLETGGVLVAAWSIIDALNNAPDRSLETVDTPLGEATITLDDHGADVHLHSEDASVHVRLD